MSPQQSFQEFTNNFLSRECYDSFSVEEVTSLASRQLSRAEREAAAEFLTAALREGPGRLRQVWAKANGQFGPKVEAQAAFSEACIKALRDSRLPSRAT